MAENPAGILCWPGAPPALSQYGRAGMRFAACEAKIGEHVFKMDGTATNIDTRVGQQPQIANATDLPLVSTRASQNQDAITGSQNLATNLTGPPALFQ